MPSKIDSIPTKTCRVIISMNPKSGAESGLKVVEQLKSVLIRQGMSVDVLTDIDEVRKSVEISSSAGDLRAVVAAGGDGTVSLLVNQLPTLTPIAILPLGTENLLAKYLGATADPTKTAEIILSGKTVRLDAGRANGKRFLVMASCGFDAEVVKRLHAGRTGHIRHWSYADPIIKTILNYQYPRLKIRMEGNLAGTDPIEARWAFVFNVPRYAMNLPILSDADPCDGQLDLCTFQQGSLLRGLYYLMSIMIQRHRNLHEAQFCKFEEIIIEPEDTETSVPFQVDGDPGGVLPLKIRVEPNCVRVLVSEAWIAQNGI